MSVDIKIAARVEERKHKPYTMKLVMVQGMQISVVVISVLIEHRKEVSDDKYLWQLQ